MDYGKIINRAFSIAWQYKILWIFGLFTGMGTSVLDWGDRTNFKESNWLEGLSGDYDSWDSSSFGVDPDMLLPLAGGLMAAMLLLGLVVLIANLISTPALIDSVNNISRGGQFKFANSFSRGVDFIWRFVGMFFIELFTGFAMAIVLLPVCIILIITIIGIPVAIALIFFAIYFWFTLFTLSERAIVVRNASIGDGLSEGWLLLKTNFKSSLMMALISIGLIIAIWVVSMIILFMIALPLGGAAWFATASPLTGFLVGFLVSVPVALVIGGYSGTALSALYTLYYFELVEPTQNRQVDPLVGNINPGPEPADPHV